MMLITLFLFSAPPGDDLPLQTVQTEALPVVIGFCDHPVRIDEEDQKRFFIGTPCFKRRTEMRRVRIVQAKKS
jgi:hypothetical protein